MATRQDRRRSEIVRNTLNTAAYRGQRLTTTQANELRMLDADEDTLEALDQATRWLAQHANTDGLRDYLQRLATRLADSIDAGETLDAEQAFKAMVVERAGVEGDLADMLRGDPTLMIEQADVLARWQQSEADARQEADMASARGRMPSRNLQPGSMPIDSPESSDEFDANAMADRIIKTRRGY